jgi:hypothetical protein
MLPWPGTAEVVTVDESNFFGTNLSGLSYQPASSTSTARLWALQNIPSKLYRLVFDGSHWVADAGAWASGKLLHYPDGKGAPDAEGVTQPDIESPVLYIASEHDNDDAQLSRLSILRLDTSSSAAELSATHEWNVTPDIPAAGANLGLEAISFVPDSALVAAGFLDEAKHTVYDPAVYPDHAGGLFLVGMEGGGQVYAYALDHSAGSFTRVASFASGQTGIMDLAYDPENAYLWGYCDNTCGNQATIFSLRDGAFRIARVYSPPKSLPSTNNEGITFAPSSECSAGQRAFFWTDDDQLDGHALRRGSIPCGAF